MKFALWSSRVEGTVHKTELTLQSLLPVLPKHTCEIQIAPNIIFLIFNHCSLILSIDNTHCFIFYIYFQHISTWLTTGPMQVDCAFLNSK